MSETMLTNNCEVSAEDCRQKWRGLVGEARQGCRGTSQRVEEILGKLHREVGEEEFIFWILLLFFFNTFFLFIFFLSFFGSFS